MSFFRILPSFPGGKVKCFTMSYDDGVREDAALIGYMEKYGIKGTFNLNSGNFCGGLGDHEVAQENADDVRARYASPAAEIACHSVCHPDLSDIPLPDAIRELTEDRKNLEAFFGRTVNGLAYPNGAPNEAVKEAARALGFHFARSVRTTGDFSLPDDPVDWRCTCHGTDPKLFDYAEDFLAREPDVNHKPLLFSVWGHAYEIKTPEDHARMEKFLSAVGGRDDVWYAANGELFDYLRDFGRLEFSADSHIIHNPTATDLYARAIVRRNNDFDNISFAIPSGKTVILSDGKAVTVC